MLCKSRYPLTHCECKLDSNACVSVYVVKYLYVGKYMLSPSHITLQSVSIFVHVTLLLQI